MNADPAHERWGRARDGGSRLSLAHILKVADETQANGLLLVECAKIRMAKEIKGAEAGKDR